MKASVVAYMPRSTFFSIVERSMGAADILPVRGERLLVDGVQERLSLKPDRTNASDDLGGRG